MDEELTAKAAAGYELGAVFLDEDNDASGAVDLADAPGLIPRKIAEVDRPLHPATLPCENLRRSVETLNLLASGADDGSGLTNRYPMSG